MTGIDIGRWDDADRDAAQDAARRADGVDASTLTERDGSLRLLFSGDSETAWLSSNEWVDAREMR